MKVLFVYPNVGKTLQECMAIIYLSGTLKSRNIETFLWDNTFEDIDALKEKLEYVVPDFVCFTALSADYRYTVKLATMVKATIGCTTIIGGPHATFLPHEVINEPCFDVVVRGEGEETLLDHIENQWPTTLGTWVKERDKIYVNPLRPLSKVNDIPWPDHEMMKAHLNKDVTWSKVEGNYGTFMTARGCPFKCTYCYSKQMQELYSEQKWTRYREIDDVIKEVKMCVELYDLKALYFIDETLTTNKKRIIALCKQYKEEIGLPWHAETRANTLNMEVLEAMADANCEVIMMGIESGSDRMRNEVYKRNMSEKTIINAFKMAKKVGIKTSAFNICGGPTETKEEIRSTIELNKKCGADVGKMTIFTAFPGSDLWDYCKSHDYFMKEEFPTNYYIDSNIKHDTLTLDELMGLRKEFVDALGGYTGSKEQGKW